MSKKLVKDIKVGERFFYGDINWVKLDNAYGGSLVLAVQNIATSYFSCLRENRWEDCSLRKLLDDFQETILHLKLVKKTDLNSFNRDLTTDDGLTDYGTCEDLVSLLTTYEYRKYRKLIPNCDDFWTITGLTVDSKYPNIEHNNPMIVNSCGLFTNIRPENICGIRPLIVLKDEVEVVLETPEELILFELQALLSKAPAEMKCEITLIYNRLKSLFDKYGLVFACNKDECKYEPYENTATTTCDGYLRTERNQGDKKKWK